MDIKKSKVVRYLSLAIIVVILALIFAFPVAKPGAYFKELVNEVFSDMIIDSLGFRDITFFTVMIESFSSDNQSMMTKLMLSGNDHLISIIESVNNALSTEKIELYSPPLLHYGLLLLLSLAGLLFSFVAQSFKIFSHKIRYGITLSTGIVTVISAVVIWIRIALANKTYYEFYDDIGTSSYIDDRMIIGGFGLYSIIGLALVLTIISIISMMQGVYQTESNDRISRQSADDFRANAPEKPVRGTIRGIVGTYKDGKFKLTDNDTIVFGRDTESCQIVFDQFDADISRKHCSIKYLRNIDKYSVIDHSRNGTFTADGHRLAFNVPVNLEPGTTIYLGNRKNAFRLE